MSAARSPDDVFSPGELARAAGVGEAEVLGLVASGAIRPCGAGGVFLARAEALRAGSRLISGQAAEAAAPAPLFSRPPSAEPWAPTPFAASDVARTVLAVTLVTAARAHLSTSWSRSPSRSRFDDR